MDDEKVSLLHRRKVDVFCYEVSLEAKGTRDVIVCRLLAGLELSVLVRNGVSVIPTLADVGFADELVRPDMDQQNRPSRVSFDSLESILATPK